MIAALLLLQGSLLVRPMYMQDEPPEARSLRGILVLHAEAPAAPPQARRSREEALAIARDARARLLAGEPFGAVAREVSEHASQRYGGVLGTVWPGMLGPALDEFLFSAEVGEVSQPIESPVGVHVLQRIERDAGVLLIQVDGTGPAARARCEALLRRLEEGEDFAELARAESDDPLSAPRGGAAAIYQRGPRDALLRAAAFDAAVGATVGPIETSFALYILRRVPPEQLDPELADDVVARGRAILVAFTGAVGADRGLARSSQEAEAIARELAERIRAGEDMAALARELDENPGGRERAGDLGWIRRHASDMPAFLDKLFLTPVGELVGPVPSNAGWVLYRRER